MHHFFKLGIQYLLLLLKSMPPPATSFYIVFPFSWALIKWFPTLPLQESKFLSQLKQIQFLRAIHASSSGASTLTILQRQAILFQIKRIHFFMPSSSTFVSRMCYILNILSYKLPIFCLSQSFFRVIVSNFLSAFVKSPFCCFSLSIISCLKFCLSYFGSSFIWLRFISSCSLVGEGLKSFVSVLLAVGQLLLSLDKFMFYSSICTLLQSSVILLESRLDFCYNYNL